MYIDAVVLSMPVLTFTAVYDMSNTTTPTRAGRGIVVPIIDTQRASASEQPVSSCYGAWPPTPPQSAHESRRPSLTGQGFSDAATSSSPFGCVYSQPPTPSHAMLHGQELFLQQCSDGSDTQLGAANHRLGYSNDCLQRSLLHRSFEQDVPCSAPGTQMNHLYPNFNVSHTDSLAINLNSSPESESVWSRYGHGIEGFDSRNLDFETTLFARQHGFRLEQHHFSPAPGVSTHATTAVYDERHDFYGQDMASSFQHPQVVVPSQLTPTDDYVMLHSSGYDTPEQGGSSFADSFDSTEATLSTFDEASTPTPGQPYLTSADDNGWSFVDSVSSQHQPSSVAATHGSRSTRTSRASRSSRRGRTLNSRQVVERLGFHVTLDSGVSMDSQGHLHTKRTSGPNKPHKCDRCGAKFERSEHLKRHASSHSEVRPFTCPIPGCKKNADGGEKGMTRGDNATDHYKTHLRGPRGGIRNRPCKWDELKHRLQSKFGECNKTEKLIGRIEKWIREHDDAAHQRQYVRN